MKIGLVAAGTRGDVEPLVALAHVLTETGHEVTLAGSVAAAGLAAGTDARFVPMDLDLRAAFESEQGQRWLAAGDIDSFMAGVTGLLSAAPASIGESVLAAADHCDVLVTSCLTEDYTYAAAQAHRVPIVPMYIFPLLATSEFPHPMTPPDLPQDGQDIAGRNLEIFRTAEEFYWRGARDDVNNFRRSLGLDRAPSPMLSRIPELGLTVLQAFSSQVVRRPADWGPKIVMTGYWRLPAEVRRRIGESDEPEDLAGWLAAGPPPVFIGFGSMPVLEPKKVVGTVAEAARLTGLRILIGAGWSDMTGLAAASLPDGLWLTDAVNHDWLFPQCQAVIHHGGAGTTAAGLIAGRATWIFSVFADQPFWGYRVARLGVGGYSRFVDFDLTHLTSALGELTREDVQQRASALGERLRAEDGLTDAVRIIEKIAG